MHSAPHYNSTGVYWEVKRLVFYKESMTLSASMILSSGIW